MARRLCDRDEKFIDEYLIDWDAKNAAIRAGYSPATAAKASEWIRKDKPAKKALREELDRRIAEQSRRTGVTADRILSEMMRVATANIDDIVDLRTGIIRKDLNRADTAAIVSVKIKETAHFTETTIQMVDKSKYLEMIGKHIGMFEKDAATGEDAADGVKIIRSADGGIEVDDGQN